jgi:hypothetical protein
MENGSAFVVFFRDESPTYLEKLPAGIRKIFFSARYFIMAHFVGWGKQRRENDNNAIARHINQSECRCVRV